MIRKLYIHGTIIFFSAIAAMVNAQSSGTPVRKTVTPPLKRQSAAEAPAKPATVVLSNPSRNPLYAQPPVHQKKVVMDTVRNELYWPQSLPFWIRLATSSRENSESFLLNKVSSSSIKSTANYGDSGIHLEVNGKQTLRWYNYVTRDTVLLKFCCDGESPTASIVLVDAPSYSSSTDTYYGKGLKAIISAEDRLSGLETIYFSVDGAKFSPYTEQIALNNEKAFNLRFYGVDRNGNQGDVQETAFIVDLTPPNTRHEQHTNFLGDMLSSQSVITISGEDQLSGINLYYHFDGGNDLSIQPGAAVPVNGLSAGGHTLHYYSVDNVQNRESAHTYSFFLDLVPPEAFSHLEGDQYVKANTCYVSQRTLVRLTARDNKVGVAKIEYSINNKEFQKYTDLFRIPDDVVISTIKFKAIDSLSNKAKDSTLIVEMDKTAPRTLHTFSGANYTMRGITWITSQTRVVLSSIDAQAGIKITNYQNGKDAVHEYQAPITLPTEGMTKFSYWSTDLVNNVEAKKTIALYIDNTPPEIAETFSVKSLSTEAVEGSQWPVYPPDTAIYLASRDNSANTEGIWFSINNEPEKIYATPLMFKTVGKYSVKTRSKDMVGNSIEKAINFVIAE
jgi:hypothetical protein